MQTSEPPGASAAALKSISPERSPNGSPSQPPGSVKRQKRETIAIACERCRKRKIKCDGLRPSCYHCLNVDSECTYAKPEDGKKRGERVKTYNNMRRMLNDLRGGTQSDSILILNHIRSAASLDDALSTVIPSFLRDRGETSETDAMSSVPMLKASPGSSMTSVPLESSQKQLPISRWTNVSDNDEMLTHLFAMFWTWDNTLTKIIHQGMLLEDLFAGEDCGFDRSKANQLNFCSTFLVNAILAVATLFLSPDEALIGNTPQGRIFADEAMKFMDFHDDQGFVSLRQGVAALCMYEYAFGDLPKVSELFECLQKFRPISNLFDLATPSELTDGRREVTEREAMCYITRGFYCFDIKMSVILKRLVTSNKPVVMTSPHLDKWFQHGGGLADGLWFPYPNSIDPQLSYHKEAFIAESQFAELAEESLMQVASDTAWGIPDYVRVKALHISLVQWHDSYFQLPLNDKTVLPTWLFLSTLYSTIVIKLLEPFTGLSFLDFVGQTALTLSFSHSDSIMADLSRYHAAFGMRHDYWLMNACAVAATTLLIYHRQDGSTKRTLLKSLEFLYEMGDYLPRANQVLNELKALVATEWISIPLEARIILSAAAVRVEPTQIRNVRIFSGHQEGEDDMDERSRITFSQEITMIKEEGSPD